MPGNAKSNQFTKIYDQDYFSGSQMFLYIGDTWIDEVTSLAYAVHQEKEPIYGYASQMWDDASAGHIMVQGQFTINYKEQGYLWAVLKRYKKFSEVDLGVKLKDPSSLRRQKKRERAQERSRADQYGRLQKPIIGSNGTKVSRFAVEQMFTGRATKSQKTKFYQDLAGFSTFDINSPRDRKFEDIVEAFEDQVWTVHDNGRLNAQTRRTDDNQFDNFDMYVVFGNYASPGANHTVQKIIDVRLTTQSKVVEITGEPVQEQYSFIARTVA